MADSSLDSMPGLWDSRDSMGTLVDMVTVTDRGPDGGWGDAGGVDLGVVLAVSFVVGAVGAVVFEA